MLPTNHIRIQQSTLQDNFTTHISGFKHAAVVVIAATILHPETDFIIDNVPLIDDVKILSDILSTFGAQVVLEGRQLRINTRHLKNYPITREFSEKIHGVLYLMPALLARFGNVEMHDTGGCQIGDNTLAGKRPVAHMFEVLDQFGFNTSYANNVIQACKQQTVQNVNFDIMSFSTSRTVLTGPHISGATKTALLAAMSMDAPSTLIENPYQKPDVTELVKLASLLQYTIHYDNKRIEIQRTDRVNQVKTVHFTLINDLSQIMTYICLAVYHGVSATLENIDVAGIKAGLAEELRLLSAMGITLTFTDTAIIVPKVAKISAIDIEVTSVGIYSDHQPFFALLLTLAERNSQISEHVWQSRFSYATELNKLGYLFALQDNHITITPINETQGYDDLIAADLRAAAVLIIAALKAKGSSCILGTHHLTRGYEEFIPTLQKAGANIEDLTCSH